MNVLNAMKETLILAREHDLDNTDSDMPHLDYPHLEDMYRRANSGQFDDGSYGEYSYGKLCRWLGYMQAAVMASSCGDITLDMLKEINKRNA